MWKRQGWQRKEGRAFKPVSNVDLWQKIDSLLAIHKVRVTHVLGHRGHPENEACDRMAVEAAGVEGRWWRRIPSWAHCQVRSQ